MGLNKTVKEAFELGREEQTEFGQKVILREGLEREKSYDVAWGLQFMLYYIFESC